MIRVLERVEDRHPSMTLDEVTGAWKARVKTQYRLDGDKEYLVAVGVSPSGRLLEIVAFEDGDDVVVFHAMKATKKILSELGML
jgi:hypothetical protein